MKEKPALQVNTMWHCISFLFLLLLPVLSTAVAIPSVDSVTSPSIDTFSLSVSRKNVGKRDFVREWTAARQKWGGRDAGPAASMFSLAEDGKRLSFWLVGTLLIIY